MEQVVTKEAILRITKYDVLEYLNQMTNRIIVTMSACADKDELYLLLEDLKRAKELVNNL